jgi:hypothetical protein
LNIEKQGLFILCIVFVSVFPYNAEHLDVQKIKVKAWRIKKGAKSAPFLKKFSA